MKPQIEYWTVNPRLLVIISIVPFMMNGCDWLNIVLGMIIHRECQEMVNVCRRFWRVELQMDYGRVIIRACMRCIVTEVHGHLGEQLQQVVPCGV